MPHRIPGLDGLRALAVFAVLLFHAAPGGPLPGGFLGVDLFFVLSGFLITGVLAAGSNLSTFYWRRLCRLGPALGLLLTAYLFIAPLIWPEKPHLRDTLLAAFYVSNWTYTFWGAPEYLRHCWSLGVEEQFYLMWPLVLPILLKARRPLPWLGAAILALTLWRSSFAADWMSYYYRTDTRLTGLLAGASLFFLRGRLALPQSAFWLGASIFALLLVIAPIDRAAMFIPVAELAGVLMVGAAMSSTTPRFLEHPVLTELGRWSYGIYLWHYPISLALRDHGFWIALTGSVAVAVPSAAVSYYSVEAIGRRLKPLTAAEVMGGLRRIAGRSARRPT